MAGIRRIVRGTGQRRVRHDVDAFLQELLGVMRRYQMTIERVSDWSSTIMVIPFHEGDAESIMMAQVAERVKTAYARVPDLRLDFIVNSIGYQSDVYVDGKHQGGPCRDFGGNHEDSEVPEILDDLYQRIVKVVKEWEKDH
jgi:hypothetical protein